MNEYDLFQLCGFDEDEQPLDFRQREVLSALSEDVNAIYSFQGLRRKLGLHQEILSRTLERLEEQDLVERTGDGYRISANKDESQFGCTTEARPIERQVVTAHLPGRVDVDLILNTLKGRWFREFRWLGYSGTRSGMILHWITEDGRIQLRANVSVGALSISALYKTSMDEERATRSALEILDFIVGQNTLPMKHENLN
jgi:DNA-binding Lrp family transcriptional regulator